MSLMVHTVALPFRLAEDPTGALATVQVSAVASQPKSAIAIAHVLVTTYAQLRHPGSTVQIVHDKARVGQPGAVVDGLYAYILSTSMMIPHLAFPARLDQNAAEALGEQLRGVSTHGLYGVLMDAVQLAYISSMGLATIGANAERLRLQLFRVQPPIAKVFEIVGLTRVIPMHNDIQQAIGGLITANRGIAPRTGIHPTVAR